ncbi:urease accessory protein UreE [Helicobacter jaachi]|uniref:Urease accessory protein UreE n=1 Tax=Helicobacter jaachi TaxID=1677920 RepID=A0A4U8T832_9HELI|nr:urease accessory protein UreE [Helicobacter jaachi]TLD95743.1 urease accessory protein UreE [Helicobacter jaachi]
MLELTQVIGNLNDVSITCNIDTINLEWYEAYKRIGRYESAGGLDIALRFPTPLIYGLNEGDILYLDELLAIVVNIIPCEVLLIHATSKLEIAKLCYEIGNAHIPLFYGDNETFLIPYEQTLEHSLRKMGFSARKMLAKMHAKKRFSISLPMQKEPQLKPSPNLKIIQKSIDAI